MGGGSSRNHRGPQPRRVVSENKDNIVSLLDTEKIQLPSITHHKIAKAVMSEFPEGTPEGIANAINKQIIILRGMGKKVTIDDFNMTTGKYKGSLAPGESSKSLTVHDHTKKEESTTDEKESVQKLAVVNALVRQANI